MEIKIKSPKICIVGSGVVGQATGRGFLSKGLDVVFADIDPVKINQLRTEGFTAYTTGELDYNECECDITILTVSTPTAGGKINLDYLQAASVDLGKRLSVTSKYHLIVVRSTVPPGTTENLVIKTIEEYSGKKIGRDFGVCMNPEYLREKTAEKDFVKPWIIIIGEYDKKSGDLLNRAYNGFGCPIYRVSLREAEMQKYVHNLFNATKITYFNEMRKVCEEIGVDAEKIFPLVAKSAEGVWNPSYGIKDLGSFSGSCLPKDTQAFLAWARENSFDVSLLETTVKVNESLEAKGDLKRSSLKKEPELGVSEAFFSEIKNKKHG